MPNKPAVYRPRGCRTAERRGNTTERGYGHDWHKVRTAFLRENSLCADCLAEKPQKITAATEAHHRVKVVDRPDLRLDPSVLVALCKMHHSRRTARGE